MTIMKTVMRMRREAVLPSTIHSRSITLRTLSLRNAENIGILTSLRARSPTVTLAMKNTAGKMRTESSRKERLGTVMKPTTRRRERAETLTQSWPSMRVIV